MAPFKITKMINFDWRQEVECFYILKRLSNGLVDIAIEWSYS